MDGAGTYLDALDVFFRLVNFFLHGTDSLFSNHADEVCKLLLVKLLVQHLLHAVIAQLLLHSADSVRKDCVLSDYFLAEAFELLHDQIIALLVNFSFNKVEILKERLLPIDDGVLRSFRLQLFL